MSEAALKALEEIMDVLCNHLGPKVLDQDIASDIDIDRHDDFRNEMREVAAAILAIPTLRAALSPAPSTDDDIAAPTGMDGADWASAFRRTAIALGYSDMDEGWLIGWFCNAIMAGFDEATQRALSPAPVGDGGVLNFRLAKDDHGPTLTFVEVENADGYSIHVGEWSDDGEYRILTIPNPYTLLSRVDALTAELANARAALAFYADPASHIGHRDPHASVYIETSAVDTDGGQRARTALDGGA